MLGQEHYSEFYSREKHLRSNHNPRSIDFLYLEASIPGQLSDNEALDALDGILTYQLSLIWPQQSCKKQLQAAKLGVEVTQMSLGDYVNWAEEISNLATWNKDFNQDDLLKSDDHSRNTLLRAQYRELALSVLRANSFSWNVKPETIVALLCLATIEIYEGELTNLRVYHRALVSALHSLGGLDSIPKTYIYITSVISVAGSFMLERSQIASNDELLLRNCHNGTHTMEILRELYLIMDSDILKILQVLKKLFVHEQPFKNQPLRCTLPSESRTRLMQGLNASVAELCRYKFKFVDPIVIRTAIRTNPLITSRQELRTACMILAAGLSCVLVSKADEEAEAPDNFPVLESWEQDLLICLNLLTGKVLEDSESLTRSPQKRLDLRIMLWSTVIAWIFNRQQQPQSEQQEIQYQKGMGSLTDVLGIHHLADVVDVCKIFLWHEKTMGPGLENMLVCRKRTSMDLHHMQ